MTPIHLQVSSKTGYEIACTSGNQFRIMGVIQSQPPGHGVTGDPRAVTCQVCKNSEAFKKAIGKFPK